MNRLRWQLIVVVLALVAIAVLLLSQQPVLNAFTPAPAEGGVYIEGLVGEPNRLNPLLDGFNPADQDVNSLVFSGLVRFDSWGNPIPDLAETWGLSLDGTVYNFTLKEGITWHDGTPLTAEDVIFTVELMTSPDLPIPEDIRELWVQVEAIAFDERNLQFRLPSRFAPFMDYLDFGVLPRHLLGGMTPGEIINAPFNLNPVGSGPYYFEELLTNEAGVEGVVLTANEAYYDERPFIDQVIFRYFANSADAYAAFVRGDVLGVSQVTNDVLPQVMANPAINLYTARLPQISMVMLNLDNTAVPFFQDLAVRQALAHAINRQWIVDEYLGSQAFIADSPVLPGSWAFNENLVEIPYDVDAAIETLRDAEYVVPAEGGPRGKGGVSLAFTMVHPDDELHTQIAQFIQQSWAELGVQVTLQAVPYENLVIDYLDTRNYEAALVDLNLTDSPDPDPYPFWHQAEATGGQNYSRWNDRRASEYLEQARLETDISDRARLYRNFQTHFNRELPAILLYYPVYNYAVSAQVNGVSVGPLYESSDRLSTLRAWFLVAGGVVDDANEPEIQTLEP
jgi:peptide/nickel transport system substrate-binding protein